MSSEEFDHATNLNAGAWTDETRSGPAADRCNTDAGSLNGQLLIVYGRGRASRVYCTVYTPADGQDAIERCIAAHGRWVAARLVPSESHDPGAPR